MDKKSVRLARWLIAVLAEELTEAQHGAFTSDRRLNSGAIKCRMLSVTPFKKSTGKCFQPTC